MDVSGRERLTLFEEDEKIPLAMRVHSDRAVRQFAVALIACGAIGFGIRGQVGVEIVPPLDRDVMQVDPRHYSVELENERVRVLRCTLGATETVPVHETRAGLVIAVTETHIRFIRLDKKLVYVDLDPGQVAWVWDDTFSIRNDTGKPVEFLFLEPKTKPDKPRAG